MASLSKLQVEEPVRLYLYTVAAAVLVLLVAVGVLTADLLPVIIGVAQAVLAVPYVDALRASVVSPATHERKLAAAQAGPESE